MKVGFLLFAPVVFLLLASGPAPAGRDSQSAVKGAGTQQDPLQGTPKGDPKEAPVGRRAEIHGLVLPGSELVVRPLDIKDPVVLRILTARPEGEGVPAQAFRYAIEWYGLEPGLHDLTQYLQRRDGTAVGILPPVPVRVLSALPEGQIEPSDLEPAPLPSLGGYQTEAILFGILWVAGIFAILFVGRRRRGSETMAEPAPPTLADRLRPMVDAAAAGTLGDRGKAELERLLIAFWRRRLGLTDLRPELAIQTLRQHPEAGDLLRAMEDWLHRPGPRPPVDVGRLLLPYRAIPADALDEVVDLVGSREPQP